MSGKAKPPIPEPIVQLQRQLDQFRSTQPRRTKLPEPLWEAAVELARQHGVYSVAQPLRLDYMGLKKPAIGTHSSGSFLDEERFFKHGRSILPGRKRSVLRLR